MSIRRCLIGLMLVSLLAGCGMERRTVHEGMFQKRRHQPGWHVDVGLRSRVHQRLAERTEHLAVRFPEMGALGVGPAAPVTVSIAIGAGTGTYVTEQPRDHMTTVPRPQQERIATKSVLPLGMPVDITPERKWNKWAVPAFVVALGAVALALFTTSTIAVIAALVVAFVFSAISIKQIRWRDERGKGFAVAALVIAVMASIATAIVTAVVGFV